MEKLQHGLCYDRAMATVAICNQKGGVGKTTTTGTLAVVLSRAGRQVHVIDMDPQASLSRRVFQQTDKQGLLYEALSNRIELPVIEITDKLSMTPASIHLAKGESQFLSLPAREYLLQKAIAQTKLAEDTLILIDCPPSLGILTFNCLTAATKVLIPISPDEFAADVLPNLNDTIKTTQKHLNASLEVLGVVLTKTDRRQKISKVFEENIGKAYPLLGIVHSESNLQYAVGGGTLQDLERSRSLAEYAEVAKTVAEVVWQKQKTLAAA